VWQFLRCLQLSWVGQRRISFENVTLRSCEHTWNYVLSPAKLKGQEGTMQQKGYFVALCLSFRTAKLPLIAPYGETDCLRVLAFIRPRSGDSGPDQIQKTRTFHTTSSHCTRREFRFASGRKLFGNGDYSPVKPILPEEGAVPIYLGISRYTLLPLCEI
jgi:hypothetical protein